MTMCSRCHKRVAVVFMTKIENGETKQIEVPVTVKQKELTGIEITKEPNKTEYTEGESFDPEGMEIIAKYNNGESIVITDYTVDPEEPLSIEDTVITIKYGELYLNDFLIYY